MHPTRFVSAVLTFALLAAPVRAATVSQQVAALGDRHAKIEARLVAARARMLDVPLGRAEVDMTMGEMDLDTAKLLSSMHEDGARIQGWLDKARDSFDSAYLETMRSRTVEARGLFIDESSLPKTPDGIRDLMDRLARAHFNMVVPEVFRRGYTLYPSRFTERDPEFAHVGFDPLALLVSEAHRHGIEVHPWIWTFRVKSPGYGDPVLSRLPALAARSEHTTDPRFLSVADPRSREWVYGLIDELTDRYDLDGLLLDYIRYDELTPDDWTSRTSFSFDYRARHGVFPTFPVELGSPEWLEYQIWRENQVNEAVESISQRLKAKNPEFQLSVSSFRGERYARLNKMQDWRHWSNNAWIDFNTSMVYTPRTSDLKTWLGWETDHWSRTNLLYSILGPLRMDDPLHETLDQIEFLDTREQPGVLLFSLSHLPMGLIEALGKGPFRRPAIAPNRLPIHAVRRVLVELDNDYLGPIQASSDFELCASAAVLRTELKKIQQSLPLNPAPYYQNTALEERLEGLGALTREMVRTHALPEAVSDEVRHRLGYAIALVKANAQRIGATRYVPSTMPPIGPLPNPQEVRD